MASLLYGLFPGEHMPEELDPKTVDKRIADRHIRAGRLDEKAWDKYLKGLPDAGEKAAPVEATMAESDFDDEDDDDGEE
jgi:hypothetical protein